MAPPPIHRNGKDGQVPPAFDYMRQQQPHQLPSPEWRRQQEQQGGSSSPC